MSQKICAGKRGRHRPAKRLDFHAMGVLTERRFFRIMGANRQQLPPEVIAVEPVSSRMDREGYVDTRVVMQFGIKLYYDLKSSVAAAEINDHRGPTKAPCFVLKPTETDAEVLQNFIERVNKDYLQALARMPSAHAAGTSAQAQAAAAPPTQ